MAINPLPARLLFCFLLGPLRYFAVKEPLSHFYGRAASGGAPSGEAPSGEAFGLYRAHGWVVVSYHRLSISRSPFEPCRYVSSLIIITPGEMDPNTWYALGSLALNLPSSSTAKVNRRPFAQGLYQADTVCIVACGHRATNGFHFCHPAEDRSYCIQSSNSVRGIQAFLAMGSRALFLLPSWCPRVHASCVSNNSPSHSSTRVQHLCSTRPFHAWIDLDHCVCATAQ